MTSLAFDTKKIKDAIAKGNYNAAADTIFETLEYNQSDKELCYKSLSLLNLICDKTPIISLNTVKHIKKFIQDSDSWNRLVTLEILYQISMYRPNLLIDILGEIRGRLFDQDPSVRRLAVKLMGTLILSLHIDKQKLHELIDEYIEKMLDNDWKVKFNVIKTIQKVLNQDFTKINSFEPLLSIVIINLRDKDDDVARSAAELLKILGLYFLSKEKIFYVLLNLLYNEKPRVKELIIWLFGEIGKEKSSEIISIIPKIINLLKEEDYKIQIKVINALVNIAQNNFDQIWANLVPALNTNDSEFRNNVINAIYHLGENHLSNIFDHIFEELENPSENIREGISLVLQRLFETYQLEIENEITKIIYVLESKYWRERKDTILLLNHLCLVLNDRKIAVWINIELNKILKMEKDSDVIAEINRSLSYIKHHFQDIESTITRINDELKIFEEKIHEFRKLPAKFRKQLNQLIDDFKFDETEIQLNKKYNHILKKIKKFHNRLNQFEYKRLAFDLMEEWEDTKLQVIDELSIIKGFITEIYDDKKTEFLESLENKISIMNDRIDVLKAKFGYIKNYRFNLNLDEELSNMSIIEDEDVQEKFAYITTIRKSMFKLDVDIRELLIHNFEFNDIFKTLLKKWITTKIKIQEYLSDMDHQIRFIKQKIVNDYFQLEKPFGIEESEKIRGLSDQIAFQLLQSTLQTVSSQGITGLDDINEKFKDLENKIHIQIDKKEFSNASRIIKMKSAQVQTIIEETDKQIDNIIGKEKIFKDNNVFNLFARPYLAKWNNAKEQMINKLKSFKQEMIEQIQLSQVKHYLKIMNPIKIDLLSTYTSLNVDQLKQVLLDFIQSDRLNAKIIGDKLYSLKLEPELAISDGQGLIFFKNIKTVGNKLLLFFKLNNTSNFILRELRISIKAPKYLKFDKNESFPKYISLPELKSGNIFKFNYVLLKQKFSHDKSRMSGPARDEIKLEIYYKDPFNIDRTTTKRISLLLP